LGCREAFEWIRRPRHRTPSSLMRTQPASLRPTDGEGQRPVHVPTGRHESRTARAVNVELVRLDESQRKEEAVTENLSPRGARVVTELICLPGNHVLLTSPQEGVKSVARVIYCERLDNRRFAVGLQLAVRTEEWARRR
jgi:hypothetical protein